MRESRPDDYEYQTENCGDEPMRSKYNEMIMNGICMECFRRVR